MTPKEVRSRCAVVILASGFDETEAVAILTGLRQAGMQAKSVGLTSGLIGGAHGVWVMPDLTLADWADLLAVSYVDLIVLPGGETYLTAIGADPRVRRLLQQASSEGGWTATHARALKAVRALQPESTEPEKGQIMLRFPEQPVEIFVEGLVLRYVRLAPQPAAMTVHSAT